MIGRALVVASLATALAIAWPVQAAAPVHGSLPPDLERALDDYNQSTIHKDVDRLSALVTDDYMLVNSDASVQDKASYLADFRVPGFQLDPYVIEQPVYKVHGRAALTGGVFHLRWIQDGERRSRTLRIAHFWVNRDGRWRINYSQLTRVPD